MTRVKVETAWGAFGYTGTNSMTELISKMTSIQEEEYDSMWISRSLAKQDRWASYEWTPEGEMEGAAEG